MCLIVALARVHPDFPLIMAANRDEVLERPAAPIAVLRDAAPRVLGGRDLVAGGTWLAVSQSGLIAGLTNGTTSIERDMSRRSRGELAMFLASHPSAATAVEALATRHRVSNYNPASLLVGDRDALFAIDMTAGVAPAVRRLPPGIHILENRPFGAPSAKVDHVRRLLGDPRRLPEELLVRHLWEILADREVPGAGQPGPAGRTAATNAACVCWDGYGTRWSAVITVPRAETDPPRFQYADGPACTEEGVAVARW